MLTSIFYHKENSVLFSQVINVLTTSRADSMSQRFGTKTGPLSNYNKSTHHLTSKFLYINTQYLGLISFLGMTPTQSQWKRGTWSTRGIEGRQVSQAIVPEIHSQRERCSQGPNPPALPYLSCAGRGLGCERARLPWRTCLLECADRCWSAVTQESFGI